MRLFIAMSIGGLLLTGATPQAPRPSAADWPLAISPITSPAPAGSAQPQLSVSDRGVLLSWLEQSGTRTTLKFSERGSTGWGTPATVASGDNWFVNWADVPSVVRLASGALAAHWLQKSGTATYAYDVRVSMSKDNGTTWSPSMTPHHDATKTEHGFASLFQMPNAGLGMIWLDGRAMKSEHGDHGSGDMSLRFTSFDSNGRQAAEVPIDTRVCECCPTSTAVTADGVIAVYRNRSPEETRDIYVTRLEKGTWTEPVPVHADNWTMGACPVNGPVVSASGRAVAVAWFTVRNDQPHAYVALSSDAGRSFGRPVQLDETATMGRVDVEILPDGSAAASYIELRDKRATFRVRRVDRSGAASAPVDVAAMEASRASGFPRLARDGDDLVFAWVQRTGTPGVRTAVARLPAIRP